MKKSNTQHMEEIMNAFFKQHGLEKKRYEMRIINNWHEIVGNTIARATKRITIYNTILFLQIDSSVIRNELQMIKSGLINKVNQYAGNEVITDIIMK